MNLIRAGYDALPPGGPFIAVEALIESATAGRDESGQLGDPRLQFRRFENAM